MKIFLKLLAASLLAFSAQATETYKFDPNHVNINWNANHFGFSNPSGKFNDVEGTLLLDEKNPRNSSVEVTIKINSLTTGLPKFDSHLKGPDFFDAEKFPTAKFVSKNVIVIGNSNAKITGDFTMRGITKQVTLDVKLNKIGINQYTQKKTVGFSASAVIKRSQFNMNFGIPGISDNVKIQIEAEAIATSQEEKKPTHSWKIIENKSNLSFRAKQNNSVISGSFKKFLGEIIFDHSRLENNSIDIDVDMSSLETSFAEASNILKTATWLSTRSFPTANFKSTKFSIFGNAINRQFHSAGTLTIKGKSVPTVLEFTVKELSENSAHVVGSTIIKRNSFNIGDADLAKANDIDNEVEVIFDIYCEK